MTSVAWCFTILFVKKKNENNSFGFQGVYVFHDLNTVTPEKIKECEQINKIFHEKIDVSDVERNFQEALWICNSQFRTNLTAGNFFQRIFIFTVNDCPNENNEAIQKSIEHYTKVW